MNSRIQLLLERNGQDEAIAWIKRTLDLYEAAIKDPSRYSTAHKELMAREAEEMRRFLRQAQKE